MKFWILNMFVFSAIFSFGQLDTMYLGENELVIIDPNAIPNYYNKQYLKDSSFKHQVIKGNPEFIEDRLIVDTNSNYLSNQVNNLYGYTYYDFKDKGVKSYEDILMIKPRSRIITFYKEDGNIDYQIIECSNSTITHYYDTTYQPIKTFLVELNEIQSDSIIAKYNVDSAMLFIGKPKIYNSIEFYVNGKVKSKGIVVTQYWLNGAKYRIGEWKHFSDINGIVEEKEYLDLMKY